MRRPPRVTSPRDTPAAIRPAVGVGDVLGPTEALAILFHHREQDLLAGVEAETEERGARVGEDVEERQRQLHRGDGWGRERFPGGRSCATLLHGGSFRMVVATAVLPWTAEGAAALLQPVSSTAAGTSPTRGKTDAPLFRLAVAADELDHLALHRASWSTRITPVPKEKLRYLVGRLDDEAIVRLNRAILFFLGLAGWLSRCARSSGWIERQASQECLRCATGRPQECPLSPCLLIARPGERPVTSNPTRSCGWSACASATGR